jgi:hypothetical protein
MMFFIIVIVVSAILIIIKDLIIDGSSKIQHKSRTPTMWFRPPPKK